MNCGVKKIQRLIPLPGAGYWPGEYTDRGPVQVANQRD